MWGNDFNQLSSTDANERLEEVTAEKDNVLQRDLKRCSELNIIKKINKNQIELYTKWLNLIETLRSTFITLDNVKPIIQSIKTSITAIEKNIHKPNLLLRVELNNQWGELMDLSAAENHDFEIYKETLEEELRQKEGQGSTNTIEEHDKKYKKIPTSTSSI